MSPTPSKYPAQVPSAVQGECPDQHHNLPWQPSSGWQETPSPWFHWQIPGVVHLTATCTPLSTNHQFGYRILGFYCTICSEVHVVWAGSQPVCSRSCKYFLPVLPCLIALPVALPIGNSVLLYHKFSHSYYRAATLPVPKLEPVSLGFLVWLYFGLVLRSACGLLWWVLCGTDPLASQLLGVHPVHAGLPTSAISRHPVPGLCRALSFMRPLSFGTCSGICLEDKSPSWLVTEFSKTLTNCAGSCPTPAYHTWHCACASVQEVTQASPMADSTLLSTCTETRNKQDSSIRTEVRAGPPGLGDKRGHRGHWGTGIAS